MTQLSVILLKPKEDIIRRQISAQQLKFLPFTLFEKTEGFLPDFLDLVLWGHEHECRIRPEFNELTKFFVTQPGSSVITALCESELEPKHVGICKIYKKSFKLEKIPLRSCRQFVMDHVVLASEGLNEADKKIELKIEKLLAGRVDKLVQHCQMNRYFYEKQPTKPLVRLKCDYTGFETINENRFAQKFIDKVANPRSILQFYKKAGEAVAGESALDSEAAKVLHMHGGGEQLEYGKVQDIVHKYFKVAEEVGNIKRSENVKREFTDWKIFMSIIISLKYCSRY